MTVRAEAERNEIVRRTCKDHLRQYLDSDGEEGYVFRGAPILVLTTTGWRSGEKRSVPLMFGRDGADYLLVASLGGATENPYWYRNLEAHPEAEIQVKAERIPVRARTATAEERPRLWALMNEVYPTYEEYQERTAREIPIVILEPTPRSS
ncbi:MAG: nitroreductase family deazaflavin-dependent oxidoreductase [Actinobacteria bacterium]|nr:nitroreductase family deazaflavin-dependent oxidoreductase [Actinomycetota bacterium]